MRPILPFALGLVAAPMLGRAANDIAVTGAVTRNQLGSVAFELAYSGDDDADAVARVEYRDAGAAAFLPGHPLTRLPGRRFVGSLIAIEPSRLIEVRTVVEDPDNAAAIVGRTSTFRTPTGLPDVYPSGNGATWVVDAASGSDANPGSAASPFASIGAAMLVAGPGDVVRVRAGTYRESVVPPSGSPAGFLTVVADGPGVVLDGSDPALTTGAAWTNAGGALWWTPFAGRTSYVAAGDARLYEYQALADLMEENGNIAQPGAFPGGFFVDATAQRLWVIAPDHASPATHAMHVAVRDSAFRLDGVEEVIVQGFEVRYYGATAAGSVGVDVVDSRLCWVRDMDIHHLNDGVRIRRPGSIGNVVECSRVRDTSVYGWPWASVKGHAPEATAIAVTDGAENVVRWNDLEGTFNGVYNGDFSDASETIATRTAIHGNAMRFIGDDGLELEGAQVNVAAWENVIRDVYNGISFAPVTTGPVYAVRNVLDGYTQHALKINNGPTGAVHVYHTTSRPAAGAAFPGAQAIAPTLPFGGMTLRNNIWEANRYVIESDTTLAGIVDWDVDGLWTNDSEGVGRFVKWLGVRHPDMAALAASGTIESRGLQAAPRYEDAAAGDFTLVAGHPFVDAGEVIDGIDTEPRRVAGAGPDLGAFERGALSPAAGCLLVRRSDDARELPGSPDAAYRAAALPWVDPDAVLGAAPALLFYVADPIPRPLVVLKDAGTVRLEVMP